MASARASSCGAWVASVAQQVPSRSRPLTRIHHSCVQDPHGHFTEGISKFYVASVALVLEHLHAEVPAYEGVVVRNLSPDVFAIDSAGYIQLLDLRSATPASPPPLDFFGYAHYASPELISGLGHGPAADFWSLGALAYEMMTGSSPWLTGDPAKDSELAIYTRILNHKPHGLAFPDDLHLSNAAKTFLNATHHPTPAKRLGEQESRPLRKHPWFKFNREFSFEQLAAGTAKAPHVMQAKRHLERAYKAGYDEAAASKVHVRTTVRKDKTVDHTEEDSAAQARITHAHSQASDMSSRLTSWRDGIKATKGTYTTPIRMPFADRHRQGGSKSKAVSKLLSHTAPPSSAEQIAAGLARTTAVERVSRAMGPESSAEESGKRTSHARVSRSRHSGSRNSDRHSARLRSHHGVLRAAESTGKRHGGAKALVATTFEFQDEADLFAVGDSMDDAPPVAERTSAAESAVAHLSTGMATKAMHSGLTHIPAKPLPPPLGPLITVSAAHAAAQRELTA